MGERERAAAAVAAAARSYEARVVIPHCASCARPCCALTDVVLELEWPQAQALYQITSSRTDFDRSLGNGTGRSDIRAQGGRYYAHAQPCPAFDETARRCRVYDTEQKPPSCTDFPIYEDGDAITADLRCEAVALEVLGQKLDAAAGPDFTVVAVPDLQFPELVSFELRRRRRR